MNLLSIVVPHYDRLPYLGLCLRSIGVSIGFQSDKCNVKVYDDCSDISEIKNIISLFSSEFPDISIDLIHNQFKQGIASAIMDSANYSDSKYTWIIGSDDFLSPKAIDYIVDTVTNVDLDLLVVNKKNFDIRIINFDNNNLENPEMILSNSNDFNKLLNEPLGPVELSLFDNFFDLIDSKYGNVFLGAIMINVFKTELWRSYNFDLYNYQGFKDLHSTYPHIPVFSELFNNSLTGFVHNNLIYVGDGIRDWATNGDFSLLNSKGDYILHINTDNKILTSYLSNGMKFIKYFYLLGDVSYNAGYFSSLFFYAKYFKGQQVFNQEHISLSKSLKLNFLHPLYYYGIFRGLIKLIHLGVTKWMK